MPDSTSSVIFASWAAELMAPTSVFLSSGIANPQGAQPRLELGDERLVDALLDEEPAAGAADLALVEVDAIDDPLDGLVERRVVEDDVRRLAAELERCLLARPGHRAGDQLADRGGAGEGDLVDLGMTDELHADVARSGDDVDHPGRQLRLAHDVGEQVGGQRRGRGGLEDDGVAAARAGAIFQASMSSGKFHGMICAATPSGLRRPTGEGVVELVRPARVVEEVGRGERHVDVARLLDRLAGVQRLDHRELARALLHDPRDAVQVLRALAPGRRDQTVSWARRAARHGAVDIGLRGVRDLRQRLLRRRVDDPERLARLRRA